MKLLFRYLRPYYGGMALGLAIKILGTLVELVLPYVLSHILDHVVPLGQVLPIVTWGGVMILCAVLALIFNIIANRMASRVAKGAARGIRHDLFEATMRLSGRQTDAFTVPSLEARLTSDTYNLHHYIGMMQRLGVRAPILLVGGILITWSLDRHLTLVMMCVLPFISGAIFFISWRGVPLYGKVQTAVDHMVRVVREDAQGIRVILALSKEQDERTRYDRVNSELVRREKRAAITMAATNPMINLFLNMGLIAVIVVGAFRVNENLSEPGRIIAFIQYFTLLSNAMLSITRIFVMTSKSMASAKRVEEVMATPVEPDILSREEHPDIRTDAHIVFDHVDFSYTKTAPTLQDINFSLGHGGTLGVIGATGSGKSTLIALLMRFYDADRGAIYIDGQDIRTMERGALNATLGVAMQNDFIIHDTIAENIRFGRDISEEQIRRAAQIAQAAPFIEALEDGYEHMLTAKGTNLSGGQRQRLLIARAIAGNPSLLLLDDSSSALDYQTDANLRTAIREQMVGTTTVVVAQRVSSVQHADLILVLEGGCIIGAGRHDELLESCEAYREISQSQMGGALLE